MGEWKQVTDFLANLSVKCQEWKYRLVFHQSFLTYTTDRNT